HRQGSGMPTVEGTYRVRWQSDKSAQLPDWCPGSLCRCLPVSCNSVLRFPGKTSTDRRWSAYPSDSCLPAMTEKTRTQPNCWDLKEGSMDRKCPQKGDKDRDWKQSSPRPMKALLPD